MKPREKPKFDEGRNAPLVPQAYKRIVVKAGTNVLTGGTDHLNQDVMASIVRQLATVHAEGREVILVTSGAIAAGRQVLRPSEEEKGVSFRQVLAAVGQSHLMHIYQQLFDQHHVKVAQALLTRQDLDDRLGYLNVRNTLGALLERRVVPVVNENDVVAVEEIKEEVFGDNDTLSALVANLVDADLLIMLTDTRGLYTADPHLDRHARLIPRVERVDHNIELLAGTHQRSTSRGGMAMKLDAAKMVTTLGATAVIALGTEDNVILRLAKGEELGTLFVPAANKMESRKRWMLSGPSARGAIGADKGAVLALHRDNRSLLPAGVKSVSGQFERGDIVYILDDQSQRVACGIANYPSLDLEVIKGARSDRIQELLGHDYGAEVVHRNNMVML